MIHPNSKTPTCGHSRCGETVFFETRDTISNANSHVKTDGSKTKFPSLRSFYIELDLLRGTRKTFLTQQPVAWLGLHPESIAANGQSLNEIWDLLDDYHLRVEFDGGVAEKGWFGSQPTLIDVNLFPID